jgi:hypothetical protein
LAREPLLSGCSIVRDARRYDYPIVESLRSLLPLVAEVVVAVHRDDQTTRDLLTGLGVPCLRLVETDWDVGPSGGGATLARQTNAALLQCRHRWALYLQADEVLHEADYGAIRAAVARYDPARGVDALSFRFLHFEGSYERVNPLRYRRQCRLVRADGRLESVRDAAGFRRRDGGRLRTRRSGARIFHYGWARSPEALKAKTLALAGLYHGDEVVSRRWGDARPDAFGDADFAFRWRGSHPAVMEERIARMDWRPPDRRSGGPLLNPRFFAAWLRKWRLLRRW